MLGTDTMLGPDAVVGTDLGVVLRTAAVSSAGPGPANQDSACAGPQLVAIADGVGGAVGGATASSLVIDWLIRQRRRPGATAAGGLSRAIAGANQRLGLACVRWPDLRTMATTLTALAVTADGQLEMAHIGDCRAHLLRDGVLRRLTRDHTWVQALVDAGTISEKQARRHPLRSVLLAVLHGNEEDLAKVETSTHAVRPGDRLVLCSDGFSGAVGSARMRQVLTAEPDPAGAAAGLLRAALDAPAQDDVTAVVADVTLVPDPGEALPTPVGAVAAGGEYARRPSPCQSAGGTFRR
jgi:serine/threonine protein phosphatase PrpC